MIQKFSVIFDNVVENKVKNCIKKQKLGRKKEIDKAKLFGITNKNDGKMRKVMRNGGRLDFVYAIDYTEKYKLSIKSGLANKEKREKWFLWRTSVIWMQKR